MSATPRSLASRRRPASGPNLQVLDKGLKARTELEQGKERGVTVDAA